MVQVPDKGGAALLLGAWQRASGKPFPGQALVGGVWNNGQGQLSLLRHAVSAPPHLVTWDGTQRLVRACLAMPLQGVPSLLCYWWSPLYLATAAYCNLAVNHALQLQQPPSAPGSNCADSAQ